MAVGPGCNSSPFNYISHANEKKNGASMRIGIGNAEEVLFQDQEAWGHIPDLAPHRHQWALSRMSPHLRPTGLRAILDFLDAAGPEHERRLSAYFGSEVTIDKFDPKSVRNLEFSVGEEPDLGSLTNYAGFCSHRDGERVKITFWR